MMRALVLLSLLVGCTFGDNVVPLDASADASSEAVGRCCLLLPFASAVRRCVGNRTAADECQRIDCGVWSEWICWNGLEVASVSEVDGVNVCQCSPGGGL